jgi:bis(5'-nucleosidyl)-tetraphosphatase
MPTVKSCGVLIVRGEPVREFLLMKHKDRWDLPKGHVDAGETEIECALRELVEETGIEASDIELVPAFRFTHEYQVRDKYSRELCDKTLVIFLARLVRDVPIVPTEHPDFAWFPWQPPHRIQSQTIDPLLAAVEQFVATT